MAFTRGIMSTNKVVSVSMNNLPLKRKIQRQVKSDLPFIAAVSMTRAMKDAQGNLEKNIIRRYDRPTRWTKRATYLQPATKRKLTAAVYFKDTAPRGNPAGKYLKPTVRGTVRHHKGFERKLIAMGVMKPSEYAVPGKGARLNQYGNMSRGLIKKVLTHLEASMGTTSSASLAGKGSRSVRYFVAKRNASHLSPGVYETRGSGRRGKIKSILMFVSDKPDYRVMLPFKRIASKTFNARMPIHAKRLAQQVLNRK